MSGRLDKLISAFIAQQRTAATSYEMTTAVSDGLRGITGALSALGLAGSETGGSAMAGISEEWEDRANEGDGAFATAVAIRELTQEVRHLGERLDKLNCVA